MTEIRIRVPRLPAGAASNLLGLAGLIAVAVCLGGLLGNWWVTGLVAGVFAVALAWVAQNQSAAARDETTQPIRPVAVVKTA